MAPTKESSSWAIVVIGSDGYFSSTSDYGNYAYSWFHHGKKDFREFLINADRDLDYFVNKLSPGKRYDEQATEKLIKEYIIDLRKDGSISKEFARDEWYNLNNLEDSWEVWLETTRLEDPYELYAHIHPMDAIMFVKKIMGEWLSPLLQKELEEEK